MDDDEDLGNEADEKAAARAEEGEAEYAFDGYRVEFNDRVALTPPAAVAARG